MGTQAQGKVDAQWDCGKPSIAHSINVGDQPSHAFVVNQTKCTATKDEMGGAKEQAGTGTEFHDNMTGKSSWHGIFVETLASGDRVYYDYKGTCTTNGDNLVSGKSTWTIAGGTGKFKGATGIGSCKGKGNSDRTSTWNCTGTYHMAGAAPAKKNM